MRFGNRILYLVDDPGMLRAQLNGEPVDRDAALARLRDDISTDEIISARHCLNLGPALGAHCYQGLRVGGVTPIGEGAVAAGGFGISVAGSRRGKGSSREQAPYAELRAGIRLVLARSFERIYRQNCHNLGIVTSTRLDLLDRIAAGADLDLDELCADLDELSRAIVAAGGLFAYTRSMPATGDAGAEPPGEAMPLARRILTRHLAGREPLKPPGQFQFFRCDVRYSHEYVTPMAAALLAEEGGDRPLADPATVLLFEDHLSAIDRAPGTDETTVAKARALAGAQHEFAAGHRLRLHGRVGDWSEGICHTIVVDRYALPGQLVIGSDSHTCHVGALGCVAVGVGASDIANSWLSGTVLLPVPRMMLIRVDGRLPAGVTEKDLMLHLLALPEIRAGRAIDSVVEFAGSAIRALPVDARCTLTNMTAEMGATSGLVAPDESTVDFLVGRRGIAAEVAARLVDGLATGPESTYDRVVTVDADRLRPMVSLPGDPGRAVPLDALDGPVRVGRAYGGSCTAAKRSDMDLYARVLDAALASGRRVHPDVEFYIQVGNQDVLAYCEQSGYLDLFERAGATVLGPSCGACINAGPGASAAAGEVTVSAQNRNFPGRSGPGDVYLASPLTVAASAVAGELHEFRGGGRSA